MVLLPPSRPEAPKAREERDPLKRLPPLRKLPPFSAKDTIAMSDKPYGDSPVARDPLNPVTTILMDTILIILDIVLMDPESLDTPLEPLSPTEAPKDLANREMQLVASPELLLRLM